MPRLTHFSRIAIQSVQSNIGSKPTSKIHPAKFRLNFFWIRFKMFSIPNDFRFKMFFDSKTCSLVQNVLSIPFRFNDRIRSPTMFFCVYGTLHATVLYGAVAPRPRGRRAAPAAAGGGGRSFR